MKNFRAAAIVAAVLAGCAVIGAVAATIIDSLWHRHRNA